jgi:hypothetical protein
MKSPLVKDVSEQELPYSWRKTLTQKSFKPAQVFQWFLNDLAPIQRDNHCMCA